MDNAIAIDNDHLTMNDTARTLSGDHESRVTDTGTSIVQPAVCKTLSAEGFDGMPDIQKGNGQPVIAVRTENTHANGHGFAEEATHTLDRASGQAVAVGFKAGQSANGGLGAEEEVCPTQSHQPSALEPTVAVGVDAYNQTLTGGVSMTNTAKNADPHHVPCVSLNHIVRRLTPVECERLQGFPDDWTRIPYRGKPAADCPDSPRYKALGNSWATNCAEYVLRRIVAAFRLDLVTEAAE